MKFPLRSTSPGLNVLTFLKQSVGSLARPWFTDYLTSSINSNLCCDVHSLLLPDPKLFFLTLIFTFSVSSPIPTMSVELCSFARWSEKSILRFVFAGEGFLHDASSLLFSVDTKKTVVSWVYFDSFPSAIIFFYNSAWAEAQWFSCPFNPWIFLKFIP